MSDFDHLEGHDPAAEEAVVGGVEELDDDEGDAADEPVGVDGQPAGNASRDEWEAYALTHGATADDLDGLGRDAIRDLYT